MSHNFDERETEGERKKECNKWVSQCDVHIGEGRSWSDQNPASESKGIRYIQ